MKFFRTSARATVCVSLLLSIIVFAEAAYAGKSAPLGKEAAGQANELFYNDWRTDFPKVETVLPNPFQTVKAWNNQIKTSRTSTAKESEVLNVQVLSPAGDPWERPLRWIIPEAVKKDDVYVLVLKARATYAENETQDGIVTALFERSDTWEKSLFTTFSVSPQWREYIFSFSAAKNSEPQKSVLGLNLGHLKQTIEITDLRLLNYQAQAKVSDFEKYRHKIYYAGQEANAKWRKAAEARIDKLRKSNGKITVTDVDGNAIPAAKIELQLHRHEFGFGTALSARYFNPNSHDDFVKQHAQKYQQIVEQYFNENTIENALKWPTWEQPGRKEDALAALDWAESKGIAMRGHNVIWPGWNKFERGANWDFLPKDMYARRDDSKYLKKRIEQRINDIVGTTKGRLLDWDVVNEPRVNHSVMDVLGYGEMSNWFCQVAKIDSKPDLYLNEYGIVTGGGLNQTNHENLKEHIARIKASGCKIDGVGFQGHFGENPTAPETLLSVIDQYSDLGLKIKITEFDIATEQTAYQANYLRDFYTAMFSHPAVHGVIMWGFWESAHWKDSAALWDKDWNIKPHGQQYIDLVFGEWKTALVDTTNEKGVVGFRGFKGDYKARVNYQGKSYDFDFTLNEKSGDHILVLK